MTQVEFESRLLALESEVADLKRRLEDAETVAGVREGISQIERGEGVPAIEAIQALGRKYGLEKP